MRSFNRTDRLNKLIKEELSLIIQRLKDPRIGFLTILDVEVTKDISLARIYVTVYGDSSTRTKTMEALENATGFIRGELANQIRIRAIPELRFIYDESEEVRERIETILKSVKS
ncbi:MAG: Ribosome-binding factor A [bacterium ADurb.Bin363]|nr:MAG: Ribosome-binding factor A [bacterium ADurb.Bin363]